MGRKKNPTPPNTEIPFKQYEKLATDLYFNQGKTPAQIKAQLGNPFWDGKEWFIEFRKTTPDKLIKTEAHKKRGQLTKRGERSQFVNDEIEAWAKRLTKEGKWPEGKSLEGFIAAEKRLQTLLKKEVERLRSLGLDVSDGHIIALANENVRGTPLDAKGQGGSHSPRSRVPELQSVNKGRGARYDIPKLDARSAGIVTKPQEAFLQYLTGDQGTGVHLTTKDKQRIHMGENPDRVIAERYDYVEGKKIEAANKKHLQAIELAKSSKVAKGLKAIKPIARHIPKVGAGIVLMNFLDTKAQAEEDPTWQNKTQAGIAGVDVALEGFELATGGVGAVVTTPLQIGLLIADQMIHQTEDSFKRPERDWQARLDARRASS